MRADQEHEHQQDDQHPDATAASRPTSRFGIAGRGMFGPASASAGRGARGRRRRGGGAPAGVARGPVGEVARLPGGLGGAVSCVRLGSSHWSSKKVVRRHGLTLSPPAAGPGASGRSPQPRIHVRKKESAPSGKTFARGTDRTAAPQSGLMSGRTSPSGTCSRGSSAGAGSASSTGGAISPAGARSRSRCSAGQRDSPPGRHARPAQPQARPSQRPPVRGVEEDADTRTWSRSWWWAALRPQRAGRPGGGAGGRRRVRRARPRPRRNVMHRDVKPANILVAETAACADRFRDRPRPRRRRPDDGREGAGHALLHGARAGARRPVDRQDRRLGRGADAVRGLAGVNPSAPSRSPTCWSGWARARRRWRSRGPTCPSRWPRRSPGARPGSRAPARPPTSFATS